MPLKSSASVDERKRGQDAAADAVATDAVGVPIAAGLGRSATQARRSERTRGALLAAAETVFARDGFDAARIEDIAALAGRTRGAFYANFSNKSDVFLALRSLERLRAVRELTGRLEGLQDHASRHHAVLGYLMEEMCDTQRLLLQIEFKLFALRHPKRLAELAGKHLEVSTSVGRKEMQDLFPGKVLTLEQERVISLSVEAVMEGFALNAIFGPEVLTQAYLESLIPRLLEQVLPR